MTQISTKTGLKDILKAGTPLSATPWDDLVDSVAHLVESTASASAAGVVELATDAEGITGTDTARAITPANLQAVLKGDVETLTGTALGTTRKGRFEYTLSATGIVSGNAVGVRGAVTLSGTVTGGAFLYGAQGKLIVSGTMNHADSRLCAGISQLDATGGTLTPGQLSGHWIDVVGISGAGGGQFNLLRMTAADAAVPNALIYAYSNATYALDLNKPTTGLQAYVAAAGSGANSAGNAAAVATRVLICNIAGAVAYIPLYVSNAS